MSVTCRILLPGDVRCLDVAYAMGVLAGLPRTATEHGFRVDGVRFETVGGVPGPMVTITLNGPMVDGQSDHNVNLHYEGSYIYGHDRELMPKSTPFWVAMGRRLTAFFGGGLAYNEYERAIVDEYTPRSHAYPTELDDNGYLEMQSRIFKLKPITSAEMNAAAEKSYYSLDEK